MIGSILLALGSVACGQAFMPTPMGWYHRANHRLSAAGGCVRMAAGVDLPTQAARQQALYDMVYVERLPEEQQMSSGLFLPTNENPRMHVCKVISVGQGREGESGHTTANDSIEPGDLVYVKDPFGIGPRDDEFSGRKFSFVRYSSICAVLPDSAEFEEAARSAGTMQAELDKAAAQAGTNGLTF